MAVNEVKKIDLEKSPSISNPQRTTSGSKKNRHITKGVGSVESSISSFGDNPQENMAKLYRRYEKAELEHMKVQVQIIQDNRDLALKMEGEISDVLKNLNNSKKIQPMLDTAKKLAEILSASANAAMGFEFMSVGAPILGSIFLSSAILGGAKLTGFFKEYQSSIEKLSFASNIAAIASANYANAISKMTPKVVQSAITLLGAVVNSGTSFSESHQKGYESQYQEIQHASQKVNNILENLLREMDYSSEKQAQLSRQLQEQVLANTRID